MVEKVRKERTAAEDIINVLERPGSLERQGILNLINQEGDRADVGRILRGEKTITAENFIHQIEDKFGIDVTAGERDPAENTALQNSVNVARNIVTDILTSPDGLLAAPAKLISAGKTGTKIAKAVAGAGATVDDIEKTRKLIGRAGLGGTLGVLSVDENDSPTEAITKIAGLTTAFGFGPPAIGAAARTIGKGGDIALNAIIGKMNNDIVTKMEGGILRTAKAQSEQLANDLIKEGLPESEVIDRVKKFYGFAQKRSKEVSFSGAGEVADKALVKQKKLQRLFLTETQLIDDNMAKSLRARGFNEEEIGDALRKFDSAVGEGEGMVVDLRRDIKKKILNDYAERGQFIDNIDAGRLATQKANEIATERMLAKQDIPEIAEALREHVFFNKRRVDRYNEFWKRRLTTIKTKEIAPNLAFEPPAFWTADLKPMNKLIEEDLEAVARIGAKQRFSGLIQASKEGVTRQQAQELGATKYARMFLTQQELEARQLLAGIMSRKPKTSTEALGLMVKGLSGESATPFSDITRGFTKTYDDFTHLMKTKFLVMSHSWLKTNFVDNIARAYFAGGPVAALRTGGSQALGTAGIASEKLTGGAYKSFMKNRSFKRIWDATNPEMAGTKINYKNDVMNAAADLGVIESDVFKSMRDMVETMDGITEIKKGTKDFELLQQQLAQAAPLEQSLNKYADFFWDRVGRYGSTMEGTARYITFEEVLKSMKGKHTKGWNVINKFGADTINNLPRTGKIPKNITHAEIADGQRLLENAAKVVKDTFFDYGELRTFEKYAMKRIFPFYTFWAKNYDFFLNNIVNPEKTARLAKFRLPIVNVGEPLSEDERFGVRDFMLNQGVRTNEDTGASQVFKTVPSTSIIDFARNLQKVGGVPIAPSLPDLGSRLNPLLKFLAESATGKDLFLGREVTPTDDSPVVNVGDSAATHLLDTLLSKNAIVPDKNGNLVTNSALVAFAVRAAGLVPTPKILDDIGRAVGRTRKEGISVKDALKEEVSFTTTRRERFEKMSKRRKLAKKKAKRRRSDDESIISGRR